VPIGKPEDDGNASEGHGIVAHVPVDHKCSARPQRAVEEIDGDDLAVIPARYDMEQGVEDILTKGLNVHQRWAGMVEALPGVIAYQEAEMYRLIDENRIGGGIALLVDSRGKDVAVAHA
jgi:hypothetical protein